VLSECSRYIGFFTRVQARLEHILQYIQELKYAGTHRNAVPEPGNLGPERSGPAAKLLDFTAGTYVSGPS